MTRSRVEKWLVLLVALAALSGCDLSDQHRERTEEQRLLDLIFDGKTEQAKAMILAGVSPNGVNKVGRSALQIVIGQGNTEFLEWLIAHGAQDVGEGSAMAKAVYERDADMVRLLIDADFAVDRRDVSGDTPLMGAALEDDDEIAKMLLDAGADVNARDSGPLIADQTALMNAALVVSRTRARERADPSLIKLLLSHGAEVNAVDDQGQSALFYLVPDNRNPIDEHVMEAARLLIEAGADVNLRDKEGMTPVLHAAYRDKHVLVQRLIEHGADVHATTNDGWTGLMLAAGIGNVDMAKTFLQHGVDVNAKGHHPVRKETWTALWAAVLFGGPEMVELLKSAGAVE